MRLHTDTWWQASKFLYEEVKETRYHPNDRKDMIKNDFEDEIRDKLAKDGYRYTPVRGFKRVLHQTLFANTKLIWTDS